MKSLILSLGLLFYCNLATADVGFSLPSTAEGAFVCNVSFGGKPSTNPYGIVVASVNGLGKQLSAAQIKYFDPSSQWFSQIATLNIGLSTELMGAGYAIHICYQGPVAQKVKIGGCKDKKNNGNGNGNDDQDPPEDLPCFDNESAFTLATGVTLEESGDFSGKGKDSKIVDLSEKIYTAASSLASSNSEYPNLSNLQYRLTTKCDLRKTGSYTRARTTSELTPGGIMEVDFAYSTSWAPVSGGFKESSITLNSTKSSVPRFCEFVYEFKETSQVERPNYIHDTDINLGLDIY